MNTSQTETRDTTRTAPRRTILKGAAWSVPAIAVTTAAPYAAASHHDDLVLVSQFGVGWYPITQNNTNSGILQLDSHAQNHDFYLDGTNPGDELTDIYYEFRVSTSWGTQPSFYSLPGSNASWTNLTYTGVIDTIEGVNYWVYRSDYVGTIEATGSHTPIPHNFYHSASSPYPTQYPTQPEVRYVRTTRYITVNGTTITTGGFRSIIANTNVPAANRPSP